MNEDEKDRLRAVEEFVAEVRGGRKVVVWAFSLIGAGLTLLGVFWDKIFGSGS